MTTAESPGDHVEQAQALVGLGATWARARWLDRAVDEMSAGLELLNPAASALCADVLEKLGEVSEQRDDLTEARRHWQQALEILTAFGHPKAGKVQARLNALRPG